MSWKVLFPWSSGFSIVHDLVFFTVDVYQHMGREHASREKKLSMVIFFIFVHKIVYRIRLQEIKIHLWEGWDQRCQQLTKPQNLPIFHAITVENVIKFNFDVGEAVHSGFTYRTFWEAMLPSLGIAWILCTNYDIQGRNLTMNKPLEKVLGFYSSPSTNLVPVRRLAAW